MKSININEISDKIIDHVIDIRSADEFKEQSIKGVKNIPMAGLILNKDKFLNKKETYYIMCRSGMRSGSCVALLSTKGYDVVNLSGGIMGYKK